MERGWCSSLCFSSLALRPFSLMHIRFWPFDYFLPRPISRSLLHKCLRRKQSYFFLSLIYRDIEGTAQAQAFRRKKGDTGT